LNKISLFVICVSLLVLTQSCNDEKKNLTEPIVSHKPQKVTPYLQPPQIYLLVNYSDMKCGVTILDTLIFHSSDEREAAFTTLGGDSEKVALLSICGSFDDGYFGVGNSLPFLESQQKPIRNNGILETNPAIDKITLVYHSQNQYEKSYSIVVCSRDIYYPPRWIDRTP